MVHGDVVGGIQLALGRDRVHAGVLTSEEPQPVDRVNRDLVSGLWIPIPQRRLDDALLIAGVPLGETTDDSLVVRRPLTSTSRQQVKQLLWTPHASVGADLIYDSVAFGVEFQHGRHTSRVRVKGLGDATPVIGDRVRMRPDHACFPMDRKQPMCRIA